jgi:hypothetical protein
MLSKDIKPGSYYRVRFQRWGGETEYDKYVRIERLADLRYDGDIYVWEGRRFQVRGTFLIRIAARDIIEETFPDEKAQRILRLMEAEGEVTTA